MNRFTLFDLFQLVIPLVVVSLAVKLTSDHLAVAWLFAVIPAALVLGFVLGQAPFALCVIFVNWEFRRLSDEEIIEALTPANWVNAPFLARESAARKLCKTTVAAKIRAMRDSSEVLDKEYLLHAASFYDIDLDGG